jgi:hypothetical protein
MVIGGIGVIAHGVPRLTRDIDITLAGEGLDVPRVAKHFRGHGFAPRIDHAVEFALKHQVLLLVHEPSGTDLDLSFAWLPFEVEALGRAERLVLSGVKVRVARAEDLVVYKAIAWRPQDQQDIERLVALHGAQMDLERVRRLVAAFAEVLGADERVRELDRIVTRATGRKRLKAPRKKRPRPRV